MFRQLAIIAAASVALSGCQSSAWLKDYVDAANTLDPDCGKRVHVKVVPMVLPWGVFPMISEAVYDKACNMGEFVAPAPAPAPMVLGSPVGG